MRIDKFLIKVLLCLGLLQTLLLPAHAQGPDEEAPVILAPSGRLNITFEQLGHSTRELDRNRPERFYRINLPGNFQITPTGNYLELTTSHMPEIPDKPAVLNVMLNGQLLSATALTSTNALSNTVRLDLPGGLLHPGSNSLRIILETSATCEDPGAIVRVLVDKNSTLSFGYEQKPYPTDLGLYPFPFVEQSLLNIPVTIVLPDRPTPTELSTAATVAAGLGQSSGGAIELTAVLAGDLTPEIQNNHHLIVLGMPDNNSLLDALDLPLPINITTLEPGHGILQEIVSPWNEFRLLLVVSGLDEEGVLKAGQALNRQAHFLGMRGPVAVVIDLLPLSEGEASRSPGTTLAEMGYEDQVVYGARPQEYDFQFALPFGWQLDEPPSFVLKFAHANILDPYESVIDLELNGKPIGSTLLDKSNAEQGELAVSLPTRLLKSGRNRLTVGVEMNFPDSDNLNKCRVLDDERAWTVISSESELFLSYVTDDLPPDLGRFPYPFSQGSGFDQTLFVMPDQLSSAVLDYLMQLAVRLGSATKSQNIDARVTYAQQITQELQREYHLILLGRPTENALLRQVNDYLPQPFAADSDLLAPLAVDTVAFAPDPNRDAGLLELINSPWNEKHTLLAITGTTDKGVQLAIQALLEQPKALKGNLAVVEPVFDPFSDQPSQISTYSIDTRPPPSEPAVRIGGLSDNDLIPLADRWWR